MQSCAPKASQRTSHAAREAPHAGLVDLARAQTCVHAQVSTPVTGSRQGAQVSQTLAPDYASQAYSDSGSLCPFFFHSSSATRHAGGNGPTRCGNETTQRGNAGGNESGRCDEQTPVIVRPTTIRGAMMPLRYFFPWTPISADRGGTEEVFVPFQRDGCRNVSVRTSRAKLGVGDEVEMGLWILQAGVSIGSDHRPTLGVCSGSCRCLVFQKPPAKREELTSNRRRWPLEEVAEGRGAFSHGILNPRAAIAGAMAPRQPPLLSLDMLA